MEGNLFSLIKTKNNHAGYPFKNEIVPRFHHIAWVKGLEVGSIREVECKERPLSRGKPGIESVCVLYKTISWVRKRGDDLLICFALVLKPGGDLYAPDNLARNVPVKSVLHPVAE